MKNRLFGILAVALLALLSLTAHAASFSGTPSGANNALKLTGRITPNATDIGKTVNVYVAADLGGAFFLKQANGSWVPLSTPLPVNKSVTAGSTIDVTVLDGSLDLSNALFNGLNIYIGYGTSEQDMLSNGKFGKIHTVNGNAAGASGTWKLTISGTVNGAPFNNVVVNNVPLSEVPLTQPQFQNAAQGYVQNITQTVAIPGANLTVTLTNSSVSYNPNIRGAVGDTITGSFNGTARVVGTVTSNGTTIPVDVTVTENVTFKYERIN